MGRGRESDPKGQRRIMRCASLAAIPLTVAGWAPQASATWQEFTSRHGLAPGQVLAIAEDRSENLWFGTRSGVSRYDGLNWTTFTTADGLPSDVVRAILCDRVGNVWLGTAAGVCRFDGAQWTAFTYPEGPANNDVYSILEDQAGTLWFGTDGGVGRYDGTTWTTLTTVDGLSSNRVRGMAQDRQGRIWFGTFGSGVSRLDGATWRSFRIADGLASDVVWSVLADHLGQMWFSTLGAGVSRFDGVLWQSVPPAEGPASANVACIFEDQSGHLWFGGDGGLARFDGETWRNFGAEGHGGYVQAIAQDRSGNLWFGQATGAGGVTRYDRSGWRNYTTADGLAVNNVPAMLEDRSGLLWFGTPRGLSRFDGSSWRTLTVAEGLPNDWVLSLMEDRSGGLWVGTRGGASRFDGTTWRPGPPPSTSWVPSMLEDSSGYLWFGTLDGVTRCGATSCTTFTTVDGLAGNAVAAMLEDRFGHVWFACDPGGVSVYDGAGFTTYTSADGLAGNAIVSLLEDRAGDLWCGAYWLDGEDVAALNRYDRSSWARYSAAEGIHDLVLTMLEDRSGDLWFGTFAFGVTRFDGSTWRTLASAEGLVQDDVLSSLEDHAGNLWFGTQGGISRYEPDRVPPQTLFVNSPQRLSASRDQGAVFAAAFGELESIEFSYRFDGSPWTVWSREANWTHYDLQDGSHLLEVRARDYLNNVDSTAAIAAFEVDATPPDPVLASPSFGAPVRGVVAIRGTAADARFARYGVTVRPAGTATWTPLIESASEVTDGLLATWDTAALPDGNCEIRLAVDDTLGLTASDLVTVRVDNHPPFDEQTAPARVVSETGGDVYTLNGEVHLYFPPHAFPADAQVTIDAVPVDSVPETLPLGASRVLPGYELGWQGSTLEKPTRLELSLGGVDQGALAGPLAIHFSADGTSWQRLGGTVEGERITLAITAAGRYALYAGGTPSSGAQGLSSLSFTPRVFSPAGTFADRRVGIGFTLGQPGSVTVRVHNRAGWVVREVARGMSLGAGSNLIWWDGTDKDGAIVQDGLYLVTVEALGEMKRQTLAVVR